MKTKQYTAIILWAFLIGMGIALATGITMQSLNGSSSTLTPGPLAVGASGISTDGGVTLGTTSVITLGNATTSKIVGGAGFLGLDDTIGATLNYNGGQFRITSATLATFIGTLSSLSASGSVAIQTLTGAKTCLGTAGVGCLTYNASGNVESSVGLTSKDGNATTPGFSFTSSSSTGISFPAGSTLGLVCGGAICGTITSATAAFPAAITSAVLGGTAASGTGITANATSVIRNWVHKVTVINTALAAAATSDVTLHITPVNTRIGRVVADVTQVFTGGTLSAMTVMCGNAAGGNQYLLANSVFTATNTWGDVVAEMGAGLVDATRADFGTVTAGVPGAVTVQCRFTCTGANCNAATQGSVTFYVEGVTYP